MNIGKYKAIQIRNTRGETATILPELGGTVYQLEINTGTGIRPVLAADSPEALETNPLFRGRLLIPFNDRIPNAKYSFEKQEYNLPINCEEDGSAIHGLLYKQNLKVLSQTESSLLLSHHFEKECEGYPFSLEVTLHYQMEENGFHLDLSFENKGSSVLPLAVGWHPYFTLGNSIDEHTLTLNGQSFVDVDKDLLPTGKTPSVKDTEIDFRSGKVLGSQELDIAITASENGNTSLTLGTESIQVLQDSEFFPYVQMYIPDDRQSIAIEPVSGATDSFNRPELGLQCLAPGQSIQTWFGVSGL